VEVGRAGERAAAAYLVAKGYRVIERNYRCRRAEVDLIVQRDGALVFVEVRTRCGDSLGQPEETLTAAKLRRLERHAQAYAAWHHWRGACRIDAVCVVLAPRRFGLGHRVVRLDHYENITA
jgi:putative endonuclease